MCSLRQAVFAFISLCTLLIAAPVAATSSSCPAATGTNDLQLTFLAPAAYCEASCWNDSTVFCSGSTCSAVDSNCPSQRGYVQCSSSPIYCPACLAACTNGTTRWVNAGCCCGAPVAKQNHRQQICVNGIWQNTTNVSCYGICSDPYGCEPW